MEEEVWKREDLPPWQTVFCPGTIRLESVEKEPCSLGRIYALYNHKESCPVLWVGQSMWPLAKAASVRGKIHTSSCYRILRGQSISKIHIGMRVMRLQTTEDINELIENLGASTVAVVSRRPELWRLK
jgi:hypothetical protein